MSLSTRLWMSAALCAMLGSAPLAFATDQPIAARQLRLRHSATKEDLLFISKDPSFLFPAIGSADDPATGSPGGAVIDLFSENYSTMPASIVVEPGLKSPGTPRGWKVTHSYRFKGKDVAVKVMVLQQGALIKVKAQRSGLALAGPQGAVGIRITTGSVRNCAFFGPATIVHDGAGEFEAKNAPADAVSDCSDTSLHGSPACGGTTPICDGVCPDGEQCLLFPFVALCGCVPTGPPVCGGDVCDGTCPTGMQCTMIHLPMIGDTCQCFSG